MRQILHRFGHLLALAAILIWIPLMATVSGQQIPAADPLLSPGQLDDLVAPIALYPDPLISQVLVASTYPLELVEANQWVQRNPGLNGVSLTQALGDQNWDPSVQSLVAFSDVLNYLTEDISWTTTLGNAFLAQEADVMDAIQRMRAKAAQTGKLATSPQQQVTQVYDSGQRVYLIAPVDPEVIYVPVYDPYYIWGAPAYYPYAHWDYPVHNSNIYFSRRVSLGQVYGSGWRDSSWVGWNDWGWRPAWGAHTVFVNNTFIAHHSFTSNRQVQTGTAQWSHDAVHRQGVPYSTPALTQRFHSNDQQMVSRPREVPVQQGSGNAFVQRTNEHPVDRSAVRQTTSIVRQGVQPSGGGSVTNEQQMISRPRAVPAQQGGGNAFVQQTNERPVDRSVVRQTAPIVRYDGVQPSGGGNVSNGFRSVEQNRTNSNPVPVMSTRPATMTPVQQPTRSFEAGRPNVPQLPVAAPARAVTPPVNNQPQSRPTESRPQGNSATKNSGGGGGSSHGRR